MVILRPGFYFILLVERFVELKQSVFSTNISVFAAILMIHRKMVNFIGIFRCK